MWIPSSVLHNLRRTDQIESNTPREHTTYHSYTLHPDGFIKTVIFVPVRRHSKSCRGDYLHIAGLFVILSDRRLSTFTCVGIGILWRGRKRDFERYLYWVYSMTLIKGIYRSRSFCEASNCFNFNQLSHNLTQVTFTAQLRSHSDCLAVISTSFMTTQPRSPNSTSHDR